MNTAAFFAIAAIFLACTVVFVGFVLVSWLGWLLGALWTAALTPFVLVIVWRLYACSRFPGGGVRDDAEPGRR